MWLCGVSIDGIVCNIHAINSTFSDNTTRGLAFALLITYQRVVLYLLLIYLKIMNYILACGVHHDASVNWTFAGRDPADYHRYDGALYQGNPSFVYGSGIEYSDHICGTILPC